MHQNKKIDDQEIANLRNRRLAYALLRVFLGMDITMHGVGRLVPGVSVFQAKLAAQFGPSPLPHWFVMGFGAFLPWCEAILGFLVLIGLFTREALVAGSLVMIALVFGSCLIHDWTGAGIQLIYAMAYMILLFLLDNNAWSVDALLGR